ncbi:MAG: WGR domain-containing protein, partial [Pleurocapsa sp. SU_196_0]|nr:WGR domain-containing protein [Pleurocapsa sp. SU_196_0]
MSQEKWYLELSEDSGGSHKFYEVAVEDTELTIRYGRIGDAGQTSKKSFESFEKAKLEAEKKVKDKKRSGYADAVQGQRQKRSVTRRTVTASAAEIRAASSTKKAPVLWKFDTKSTAFGICVTDRRAWVGNEAGDVYALSLEGVVEAHFKLPDGVKCIIEDGDFLYAGCDNGKVYDLNGKVPRVAYEISDDVSIYWLDIHDALLAISDADGGLTLVDHNDEFVWNVKSGGSSGWMVRTDATRVYHGTSTGVTAYETSSGQKAWQASTHQVLFGWQSQDFVYPGTGAKRVHILEKATGKQVAVCECDSSVPSNAASTDGRYVFAADSVNSVYCFDAKGERLWKLATGCGSALSMQYHNERVYIVTTNGSLACVDASEAAIEAAKAGQIPDAKLVLAANTVQAVAPAPIATTNNAGTGGDGGGLQPGFHRLRRRIVRTPCAENLQGDGQGDAGGCARYRPQRQRRRAHSGRRGESGRLCRGVPAQCAGVGRGTADQLDHGALCRRRSLFTGDDRFHLHGEGQLIHVRHRSRRGEDSDARDGDPGGTGRRAHAHNQIGCCRSRLRE